MFLKLTELDVAIVIMIMIIAQLCYSANIYIKNIFTIFK